MLHRVQAMRPLRTLPALLEPLEHRTLLAAADLDTTFSGDGVAITDHPSLREQYSSVALAPDGRLVLAGTGNGATTGQDFVVARLLPDGTRDSTFNRGAGSVQTDTNTEHNRPDGLLVQPDGKIVVVGASYTRSILGSAPSQILVIRYRVDGTLDTSFGTGGRVFLKDFVPGDDAYPSDIIIQPDGKLVISGSGRTSDYLVARLLPNGQPDPTFGGGDGKFVTKPQGVTTLAGAEDLALAPDGKIIVVGDVGLPDTGGFGVIKLNPDGTLDTTFGGGDGKVTTTFSDDDSAGGYTVGVYGDGKFVVGGYEDSFDKFALARYNPDGSLDTSFSSDGRVVTDLPGSGAFVRGLQVLADGDVLAVGSTGLGENAKGAAVVRYNYNGSLDTAFSGDGILTTKFGLTQVRPDDMAVRPDGRFIVAAVNYMDDEPYWYRFVSAQYQGGTPPNGAWIAGRIFDDRDRNNQFNTGDAPLAGARVFIDADNDYTYDATEKSVLTNAEGNYAFTFLAPGDYRWGVVPPAGFEPHLSSGFYSLPLAAGQQMSDKNIALVRGVQQPPNGTPGNDTFLVRLHPSRDALEIFDNATGAGTPVYRGLPSQLSLTLLGGDDVFIIDATNGNPIPSGGITIKGSDGHDVLRLVGSSGPDEILVGHSYAAFGFSPTVNHYEFEDTQVDGAGGWDSLQVTVGRATLVGAQDLQNLRLLRGTSVVVPASGDNTLQLRGLTMEPESRLDINDNDLILHTFSPTQTLPTLRGYLATARNATPPWSKGLTSSAALNDPLTGLAYSVGTRPVGSDYVPMTIRHTWNGDANLDGRVNADDYFAIDSGFLARPQSPAYAQGDFNYDGRVNADDYFLIDSAFLGQSASPPSTSSGESLAVPGATASATADAAEPVASKRRRALRRPFFSDLFPPHPRRR